jgi:hypothetical protein
VRDADNEIDVLKNAYSNFNSRDIDAVLQTMHLTVEWPNGMEGGIEHGHNAIRSYWKRQWSLIDPIVEPIKFELEPDGRMNVTVHQVVRDLDGKLLLDGIVHHIYTFDKGLIKSMEIKK